MTKINSGLFRIIFLTFIRFISSCGFQKKYVHDQNTVSVHFIDVEQGDCTLIQLPENKVMLIDAGENGFEEDVFEYLDSLKIEKIDYLVATHPHSDHIGGMEEVIKEYDIGEIYMPNAMATTKTYENMLDEIDKKNMKINSAYDGKTIFDYSGVRADIIAPQKGEEFADLNNYSAVVKLTYGEKSFLFMGDAEKEIEEYILKNHKDLKSDVLKVGHHGSSTSSEPEFIEAVNPEYAIISCGKDNEYGHPHKETLKTLKDTGTEVLRTDKMGTIIVKTDGKTISVEK